MGGLLSVAVACSSPSTGDDLRRGAFTSAQPVIVEPAPAPPLDTAALDTVPPSGTLELVPGAFSDTLRWDDLTFQAGPEPRVAGEVVSTIEVAPLLLLEVRATFYDAAGQYLGDATFVEEGHGDEDVRESPTDEPGQATGRAVTLEPTSPLPRAADSARLSVLQFVSE